VSFVSLLQPEVEVCFSVYGFSFVLRTNCPEARDSIARLYGHFLSTRGVEIEVEAGFRSEGDGFRWRLGDRTDVASDMGRTLRSLESALCEAILRSQRRLIAIHAATVYSGDSAVMLVGPSGAGKSTLSVALSRRGLTLETDDVALIDPQTLHVLPIPRCVHLDQESIRLLEADDFRLPDDRKRFSFLAPFDLDSRPIPECGAGLLIYIAGPRAQRPHLKPVSQSEMAARLLSETGQGPLSDSENVGVFARMASSGACFHLVPGSLSETADLVSDHILRNQRTQTATERRDSRVAKLG
jgi:energy-coupling factor transporter ATP-binding protein EcfA2